MIPLQMMKGWRNKVLVGERGFDVDCGREKVGVGKWWGEWGERPAGSASDLEIRI